jgi:hypothetical protein
MYSPITRLSGQKRASLEKNNQFLACMFLWHRLMEDNENGNAKCVCVESHKK